MLSHGRCPLVKARSAVPRHFVPSAPRRRLGARVAARLAHARAGCARHVFAAWLLPLFPLLPMQAAPSASYLIDSAHSQAVFGVRLLWLHEISGRFRHIDGAVLGGPRDGTVVVRANIAVDSVTMDSARMRRWVLAPEFFDVADYPFIRFVSDPLPLATLEYGGPLPGRLSLRGVTAPVTFTLHPLYCTGLPPTSCRISLNGTLQRGEFGMIAHGTTLSDRVELNLAITLRPIAPAMPSTRGRPPHAAKKT